MKVDDCPDCDSAMDKLEAYVDRELTEGEMAQVRHHLAECPDCDTCFDFQEHLKVLVRRKGCPETAPPSLVQRVLANFRGA